MKWKLNGLSCPSCAKKIETKLQEIDPKAIVNYNTGILNIDENLVDDAAMIIEQIEPSVKITPFKQKHSGSNEHHSHNKPYKGLSVRSVLILAALVFVLGFIYKPLFLVAFLIPGYPVILSAIKGIIRRDFLDEKFLMSIATLGAVAVGEWAEAAVVMILYNLGEYLEEIAGEKTRNSVSALLDLTPEVVTVLKDENTTTKAPEDVLVGEIMLIKAGERVPLDGIIKEGSTTFNTSALTGESLPKPADIGDFVMSGVINLSSPIKVEVKNTYSDSTVAKMLRLLEDASLSKAPPERFITRFARVYTPLVVLAALLLALLPPLFGFGTFTDWGYRALVLLVVSCPCALVISVPMSYFSGMGRASQLGILVKSGEVLDRLKDIDVAVWDKTGTLTNGEFEVINIKPAPSISENELLTFAFSLEQYSAHPLAKAIIKKAKELNLKPSETIDLKEIPGKGVEGIVDGNKILAGSLNYLNSLYPEFEIQSENSATAIAIIKINSEVELLGVLELADSLKDSTKKAIISLKSMGLQNVVLTGDRKESADFALRDLGIDEVKAELLPEDKLSYIRGLKNNKKTMFIGDGINDVPVITSSYVGVAMGGIGSDAAIEASDIVLITDEPKKIPLLLKLAKTVRTKVFTNITLTLSLKFLVIGLSIFGLSSMWQAIIADVGVTIVATLNAASIFNRFNGQ